MRLSENGLLRTLTLLACLTVGSQGWAQTVRFSGSVRAGETFRHPLGRGLVLVVTTQELGVRRMAGADGENFAACETLPAHGLNDLELNAWQFDRAHDDGSPWMRRAFLFALTAAADRAACKELERALYQPEAASRYLPQRLGKGLVTLSDVKLSDERDEIKSFRFHAAITLPRRRPGLRPHPH